MTKRRTQDRFTDADGVKWRWFRKGWRKVFVPNRTRQPDPRAVRAKAAPEVSPRSGFCCRRCLRMAYGAGGVAGVAAGVPAVTAAARPSACAVSAVLRSVTA